MWPKSTEDYKVRLHLRGCQVVYEVYTHIPTEWLGENNDIWIVLNILKNLFDLI